MATLPPLNAPPIRTPIVGPDGRLTPAWEKWFDILWRKTGEATMTAPLSISGVAAQATTAASVPPAPTTGAPTTPTAQGSFAYDSGTGDRYYNPTGHPGDWTLL